MPEDTRNVVDEFKGMTQETIIEQLDARGVELEIAIENQLRDFNMGSIVRSANAFGVRHIHVIGRKQWNKRGAMMTDTYLHMHYYPSTDEFVQSMKGRHIVAVDNVTSAESVQLVNLPGNTVFVFGAEGPGLSDALIDIANQVVMIDQRGSTRSLNVGVAAGIVMYEWSRQRLS